MWTDILFSLEVLRRKIRRFLARGDILRRIKGQPVSPEADPQLPGLLLLQIDGLAFRQFERGIAAGKMPFLKSLMDREGYNLHSMYSGIPTTTPAVQAELYYGVRCAVPAFGYLDREAWKFVLMQDIEAAQKVEQELKEACKEPLLKGGSSYMNVYSGGASFDETHFCSVTFRAREMLSGRSLLRVLGIVLAHLPAVLRLIVLTLAEVVLGLWDMARAVVAGESFLKELEFIISRVIVGAALREALVLGGTIDLNRGLPVIHVNFLGYDERSHRRGPSTKFAHAELRRIDRAMKQLFRASNFSDRRDYQVWVFSDHGHEDARSYEEQVPGGVGQTVYEALKSLPDLHFGKPQVFSETEWGRSWLGKARIRENLEDQEKPDEAAPGEENAFAVLARGPVGHIYLASRITEEQKLKLAQAIVRQSQVPAAAFSIGPGKAVWVHRGGSVELPEGANDFFPHAEELRQELGRDLACLCEQKHAGDLILFGWEKDNQPWTFPYERGAHAGPGLDETQGFVLLPGHVRLPRDVKKFIRPEQLRKAALHALGREPMHDFRMQRTDPGGRSIRVMTYNVHSCVGLDGRLSCSRISRIIQSFDPDIVALQEVDISRKRSRGENQVERLATELQMHHEFCSTVQSGTEHYGHALLSRFPIKLLACGRLGQAHPRQMEPRGALLASVSTGGAGFCLINTHLGLTKQERMRQLTELLGPQWMEAVPHGTPLVFCGDFNMLPGSQAHKLMLSKLRDTQHIGVNGSPLPTFVSSYPFTRLDYIFVSESFKVDSVRAPRNSLTTVASDHLPLIADLRIE